MTKFAHRADGDAASLEKCADKPSEVNWRPIGGVVLDLIVQLSENSGGIFQSTGQRDRRWLRQAHPHDRAE